VQAQRRRYLSGLNAAICDVLRPAGHHEVTSHFDQLVLQIEPAADLTAVGPTGRQGIGAARFGHGQEPRPKSRRSQPSLSPSCGRLAILPE
jgi:hypothetical protein